jgi:hypothetical protein
MEDDKIYHVVVIDMDGTWITSTDSGEFLKEWLWRTLIRVTENIAKTGLSFNPRVRIVEVK